MSNHKPADMGLAPGTLLKCPGCGLAAEISDRFTLDGAPEPVEHVKLVCVRRHWYTVPVDVCPVSASASEASSTSRLVPRV